MTETKPYSRRVGLFSGYTWEENVRGEIAFEPRYLLSTATSVSSSEVDIPLEGANVTENGLDKVKTAKVEAEWRRLQVRRARTKLGERLRQIREEIVESGQPLLGWDDLEKITAELRGEL